MKHEEFSLTNLIRDDAFIQWVKSPDEEANAYWEALMLQNPEKKKLIEMAREYVLLIAVDTGSHIPTDEQSRKMWQSVKESTIQHTEETGEATSQRLVVHHPLFNKWIAAAVIIISLTAGYWLYDNHYANAISNEVSTAIVESDLQRRQNTSEKPMTVLLSDGSSVILYPGAEISYENFEGKAIRRIDLKGKAFFEVAKFPDWPLLVYSKGIVTRVLGTSFEIDAPDDRTEISIAVITGKVSVYKAENSFGDKHGKYEEVILVKNQKMAFEVSGSNMVYKPISNVINRSNVLDEPVFLFDEAAVSDIFDSLESHYGVSIIYDRNIMGNCPLTATLTGYPLNKKMEIICSALMAEFKVTGNRITVTGKGCR